MFDRDGATERQVRTVQFISVLAEVIKDHLCTDEIKGALDDWELEPALLKKLDPLYYKKGDKGKILYDQGATFYPKLLWWKAGKDKNGKERPAKMASKYYLEDEVDENGEQVEVNPLDFMGVRHYITPAIKFESVFMGAKTKNIQCKVYEAEVKLAETGPKRLLKVQANRAPTVIINGQNPLLARSKPESKEEKIPVKSAQIEEKTSATVKASPVADPSVDEESEKLEASGDEGDEDKPVIPAPKKVIKKKVSAAPKKEKV
jgi:hypothetical protein